MFRRVVSRLSYANVVATLALFFALGGSAYGLIVTGELVKDESLADADIRDGSLAPAIADDAVTGGKVADNSLSGDDVDEATLRGLPRMLSSERSGAAISTSHPGTNVTGDVTVGEGESVAVTATVALRNESLGTTTEVTCRLQDQDAFSVGLLAVRKTTITGGFAGTVAVAGATTSSKGRISLVCRAERAEIAADGGSLVALVEG